MRLPSNKASGSGLTRRPIPNSFIVMAPKDSLASQVDSKDERLLGSTTDTAFLLVSSTNQLQSLTQEEDVRIFPNYEYQGELYDAPVDKAAIEPQTTPGALPRHLEVTQVAQAWEVTKGEGAAVSAVTDTGLDLAHPKLEHAVWANPMEIQGNGLDDDGNGKIDDLHGWDFSDHDNQPGEASGRHHTHVFGVVHADEIGVAPEAKGMALRIAGGKRRYSSSVMIESYLYALNNGAKSINTSFDIDGFVGDRAIEATYRQLADNDVLLFNSAGNRGRRNPKRSVLEDVVLVAATQTERDLLDKRSEFSNYGAGIDISAPGSDIISTLPNGRTGALSGTSMATPQVMGVDLLLQSAHPDWNREQRWAQIAGTADQIDDLQEQAGEMGYGRLNAGRALTEVLDAPSITPILSTFPNGQTMDITMRFDKVLDPKKASREDAWRIVDDQGKVVRSGAPKEIRLMTNQVKFNVADLPKGSYKLIGSAEHLCDPFGQPLDGNKDGVSGDDLVVEFQRIS